VGSAHLLQFRLKLFDELIECHRELVKRGRFEKITELTGSVWRKKMRKVEIARMSVWSYGEHPNEVQTEVCKVR
jgi:hypothetical protein